MSKAKAKNNTMRKGQVPVPGLVSSLLRDIFVRHWLLTILLLLNLISAVRLAHNSHQMRRATSNLQAMEQNNEEQQLVRDTMRLEYAALTEPDRVASLAKKKLGMVEVNASNEKVISQ